MPSPRPALSLAALTLAAVLAACSSSTGQPGSGTRAAPETATAAGATAGGTSAVGSETPASPRPTPPRRELPRGGTDLFPTYRLFGYSGYPGAPGQGRLGIGDIDERMREIEQRGKAYAKGRKVMPVMELIAVTVQPTPGRDGMYRVRTSDAIIKRWLKTARKHEAMLLLNIQPGRSDFLTEVKHFEKYLREPDVGVALDPEWAVGEGQVPGRVFGSTSGKELNTVAVYLSDLVAEHHLPEKVMLYHQLHANIVRKESRLKKQQGVVLIKSIDGIGSPAAKINTYNGIVRTTPKYVHKGFKLFYAEDVSYGERLMSAKEVMAIKPRPEYVLFE